MKIYFLLFLIPLFLFNILIFRIYILPTRKQINETTPIFEDFINYENSPLSDVTEISENWHNEEADVLSKINVALQTQLMKVCTAQNIIRKDHEEINISMSEIQKSVQVALALRYSGKSEKALKVIEHAVAIAPNNPDILNFYGEILEIVKKDVIAADELYTKALMHYPGHKDALMNRQRTVQIVEQLDLQMFQNIDNKRDMLKNVPDTDAVFNKFKKQAYYLHIYHTVGIEGNTLTIEQLRYLLETGRAVFGKSIIEHNEILGLQLAMKYVKLLVRVGRIEIKEILGIHRRVMGHVDPLSSGSYRQTQVYVGSHTPPTPEDIPILMEEFADWLNSEEAANMHPVRYAALAHYKLVDIHPFEDGNGRTSRLLMNLILIRAGYPPVIILKEHRQQYYDYLKIANKGDVRPFVRFIAQCTEQVLDLYLWGVQKFTEYANLEDLSIRTITAESDSILSEL